MINHKTQLNRYLPFVLAGAGIIALVAAIAMLLPGEDNSDPVGNEVISMLDGTTVDLADYRGRTIVLNFWASWCPPCIREMPLLQAYYNEHKEEGLIFIAINSGESSQTAYKYIADMGYRFPVGLDESYVLSDKLGIVALPMTIVINPEGQVHYQHRGEIFSEVLEAQVTPLLSDS